MLEILAGQNATPPLEIEPSPGSSPSMLTTTPRRGQNFALFVSFFDADYILLIESSCRRWAANFLNLLFRKDTFCANRRRRLEKFKILPYLREFRNICSNSQMGTNMKWGNFGGKKFKLGANAPNGGESGSPDL